MLFTSSLDSNQRSIESIEEVSYYSAMALKITSFINFQGLKEDAKSKNFSVYGQWNGILCIILCLALGIANIFHFSVVVIFSVIAIVQGLVLIFVEIPFLLRICPLSENFNTFIKRFNQNWPRAGFYLIMSVIQFLSLIVQTTSLLVPAIFLLFSAIFYALAAFKHQQFQNSSAIISTTSDNFPSDAIVREIL